jgi:hypothetical protein
MMISRARRGFRGVLMMMGFVVGCRCACECGGHYALWVSCANEARADRGGYSDKFDGHDVELSSHD